jgi:hypothetical protein
MDPDDKRDDRKPAAPAEPRSLSDAVDDVIQYAAEELGLAPEEAVRAIREGRLLAPPGWLERRRGRERRERLGRLALLLAVAVLLLTIGLMRWLAR